MTRLIKRIPSFDKYFISNDGVVYSTHKSEEMKPIYQEISKSGHRKVSLSNSKKWVHRLVLEVFVGECPEGYQCRHLDGDPSNNNLFNLRWGTRSQNQLDRHGTSTDIRGENHHNNKLEKEDVLEIRRMAKLFNKNTREIDRGGDYDKIAKKFNIAKSTVGSIVSRRTWKWLKEDQNAIAK